MYNVCCYLLIAFIIAWIVCCCRCKYRIKKFRDSCGCSKGENDCDYDENDN